MSPKLLPNIVDRHICHQGYLNYVSKSLIGQIESDAEGNFCYKNEEIQKARQTTERSTLP
ncbi:hypothetical protein ACKFKF_06545 [Phormidesmis sp. 146-12]